MSIAIILAAGKGSRMRSVLPKPLVLFRDKPIVQHVIDSFKKAAIDQIYLVIGHGGEAVKQTLGETVEYVYQKEQKGTAHAVQQVYESTTWSNKNVFVCVGDSPLLTAETILKLEDHHLKTNASCTFLTAIFPVNLPYARVIKNEKGEVLSCVEEKNATPEQRAIRELLSSHFIFKAEHLFAYLSNVKADQDNGEFYLTDMIGIFIKSKLKVESLLIENYKELVGLNTPEDIVWAEQATCTQI